MSRSIDLFIDCDRAIDEVADEIRSLARMELRPGGDGTVWVLEEGGVRAELRVHPFLNDAELLLERYRYVLGTQVSNGTRLLDAAETALLRLVSEGMQKGGYATLLVHDLQYRDPRGAAPPTDPAGGPADPAGGATDPAGASIRPADLPA
ncbi:MAG: hypothetical protein JO337_14025 [Acidimicrobiales bacterium]|nr:hypothetical protein [Acidimicrobiales bacterium]